MNGKRTGWVRASDIEKVLSDTERWASLRDMDPIRRDAYELFAKALSKALDKAEDAIRPVTPTDPQPKIVQLLLTPEDSDLKGVLLGLGSDGATYYVGKSERWELAIPPLGHKEKEPNED